MTITARLFPVLALAACALTLRAAQPARVQIAGTVVDSAGKPIEGATVEGYKSGNPAEDLKPLSRLTTGADGAFSFEGAAGTIVVLGHKSGLAPGWARYLGSRQGPDE